MGTVHRLSAAAGDITLGRAVDAYLATLSGSEQASTRRTYGRVLRWIDDRVRQRHRAGRRRAERFAAWFGAQWGDRAPSTWNVSPRCHPVGRRLLAAAGLDHR